MKKTEYILRETTTLILLAVLIICVAGEPTDADLFGWIRTMAVSKVWAILAGVCLWAVIRFWAITPGEEKRCFGYDDEEEDYWS